jgi:hypothetical protein
MVPIKTILVVGRPKNDVFERIKYSESRSNKLRKVISFALLRRWYEIFLGLEVFLWLFGIPIIRRY